MNPVKADIASFLGGVPRPQRPVVDALRKLVRQAAPHTVETVLWRSLFYHRPELGGRIAGAVCLITPGEDGVRIGFIHGAALADPDWQLRGDAKAKRFVPIRKLGEVRRAALRKLIRAAANYDPRQSS